MRPNLILTVAYDTSTTNVTLPKTAETLQFIRMLAEFMLRGWYIDWIFFLHFSAYVFFIVLLRRKDD